MVIDFTVKLTETYITDKFNKEPFSIDYHKGMGGNKVWKQMDGVAKKFVEKFRGEIFYTKENKK